MHPGKSGKTVDELQKSKMSWEIICCPENIMLTTQNYTIQNCNSNILYKNL